MSYDFLDQRDRSFIDLLVFVLRKEGVPDFYYEICKSGEESKYEGKVLLVKNLNGTWSYSWCERGLVSESIVFKNVNDLIKFAYWSLSGKESVFSFRDQWESETGLNVV